MRRVMHGDIVTAARALLSVPNEQRRALCRCLIQNADFAHRYFKRFGRSHHSWGDGSLMLAASKQPMPAEPDFSDSTYCRCVAMVLNELLTWRDRRQITRMRS